MNRNTAQFLVATTIFLSLVRRNSGGSCWSNSDGNGKCGQLLSRQVTFEQCCQSKEMVLTTNQLGYSDRDAKDSKQLFFLIFLNRPTVCKPCSLLCSGNRCSGSPCTKSSKRKARCVCDPDCSNSYKGKVCSTDQTTYPNECALLRDKCSSKKKMDVDYYSECKVSCKSVTCPKDKICVEDQYRVPHCITNAICKTNCRVNMSRDQMLCGTNGVTYLNRCFLRQAVCHLGNGKSVGIAYKGRCKMAATCNNIKCPANDKCLSDKIGVRCVKCKNFCIGGFRRQLVCGSNGVTYRNWCSLRIAACNSGKHISVLRNGSC